MDPKRYCFMRGICSCLIDQQVSSQRTASCVFTRNKIALVSSLNLSPSYQTNSNLNCQTVYFEFSRDRQNVQVKKSSIFMNFSKILDFASVILTSAIKPFYKKFIKEKLVINLFRILIKLKLKIRNTVSF